MKVLFMRGNQAFIDETGLYEVCRLVEPTEAIEDGPGEEIEDRCVGKEGV